MRYVYGMRHQRGFGPGCQPKEGLVDNFPSTSRKYAHMIVYDRKLTDNETSTYDLDLVDFYRPVEDELEGETKLIVVHKMTGEILGTFNSQDAIDQFGGFNITNSYSEYDKLFIWINM